VAGARLGVAEGGNMAKTWVETKYRGLKIALFSGPRRIDFMKKVNFRKLNGCLFAFVIMAVIAMAPGARADNNVWSSAGSTDGGDGANWSLGHVPTTGEVAYFDVTSVVTCDFSGPISCAEINVTSGYSGNIDFNDQAISTTGDQTYDGTGEVKCGDGIITCSGNFDNRDQGTWVKEYSTLVMDGTNSNETIITTHANQLHDLTIDGTLITVSPGVAYLKFDGTLTVNNGKQLTFSHDCQAPDGDVVNDGTIDIAAGQYVFIYNAGSTFVNTGIVSGGGRVALRYSTVTNDGTWSVANTELYRDNTIGGGTYGGSWLCRNEQTGLDSTLLLGTAGGQTLIFTGDITFDQDRAAPGIYTVDCATFDPNLEFQCDVTLSTSGGGTLTWSKGTGTIFFNRGDRQYLTSQPGLNLGNIHLQGTSTYLSRS